MTERAALTAAVAAVALFAMAGVLLAGPSAISVGLGVAAVAVAGVLGARAVTGWPLVLGLVVEGGIFTLICDGQPSNLGWFGLCVLAGWAAAADRPPRSLLVGAAAIVALVAQWLALSDEPGWGAWIAGTLLTMVAGAFARRQRELVEQLRAAQAGLTDRARNEERNRIAHELHDVIGHALTVSLLHVTSARLALAEDPTEAEASLAEAERLAQRSLAEVRSVVGMMQDAGSQAPLPGAAELESLVDSFRRAGTDVSWQVVGDLSALTAAEGLTVYRIVQEALTNVARHAPGSPVTARLELGPGGTHVVVDSDGAPAHVDTSGNGLAGMRARAEALGGVLTAGPRGSGWRVEAELPT